MNSIKSLLIAAGLVPAIFVHAQEESRNIIQFSLSTSNNYVNSMSAPVRLDVFGGQPSYMAVSVDDTNYAKDANWQPFSSNLAINLGTVEGWHEVWIGAKGSSPDAQPSWQWKRFKMDFTPPLLVITNPTGNTISVPLVQVMGYSPEEISHISYDLSNATGFFTDRDAGITDQHYDNSTWEFTTNYFECVDVSLTNGLNVITIHATDMAGNMTTTNISITLDYSSRTNPPMIRLFWPQNGEQISQGNFTWRGWVDDPTARVSAQIVGIIFSTNINTIISTNGNAIITNISVNETTNTIYGLVERNGNFWVENLPMLSGTNSLMLTVADSAGNRGTTNIIVSRSPVTVTMNPVIPSSQLWQKTVTLTGTVSNPSYSVWINGVKATVYSDGTWKANNVPTTPGGTAVFDMKTYAPSESQPSDNN